MTTVQKNGYTFYVDIEKTKEYYKTHSLCECSCCRNYYTQVTKNLPVLSNFLSEFGVDAAKPDETMSIEADGYIDYIGVDYTVCGFILTTGQSRFDIQDDMSLHISITDGFSSPNEQVDEYFTISVEKIEFPWVLDEPFPTVTNISLKSRLKDFFKKIFKR